MANEVLYRPNMIGEFLGKGERLPDQTRHPLSQGAVESFDVIGNAPLLFDHSMLLCWNHTHISLPAICIEPRMLSVELGYQLPKGFGTNSTPVSDMECDDLPTTPVHSNPYPLLVCFLTDEALHLIDFGFKRTDYQFLRKGFDLEVGVIGQLIIQVHHKNYQPAQTHALHSTDPPQRYPFDQQSLYPFSLGGGNENLLGIKNELSPTFFTTVILLTVMNMTVLFSIRAVTGGAMSIHGWLLGFYFLRPRGYP